MSLLLLFQPAGVFVADPCVLIPSASVPTTLTLAGVSAGSITLAGVSPGSLSLAAAAPATLTATAATSDTLTATDAC